MDIVGDAGIGELAWCVTRTKKMPIYQHLSLSANRTCLANRTRRSVASSQRSSASELKRIFERKDCIRVVYFEDVRRATGIGMKQFGTHLPVLRRTKVLLLIGQVRRVLDANTGGAWQVISDEFSAPDPSFTARRSYALGSDYGLLQVICQVFTTLAPDLSLYVTFEDEKAWQAVNEQLAGSAMQQVHNAVSLLFKPPAGIKMWLMTTGEWVTGVYFDS